MKPFHSPRLVSPVKQGRAEWIWSYVAMVLGIHLLALLAFVPWLFSWTGVVLAFAGTYFFGVLGVNIGFHRLLSHRSFKCPKWLEYFFALVGTCCLQGAPIRWIVHHRLHHQYSDQEQDPHSPLVSFLWAHLEWMLTEEKGRSWLAAYDKYAPDMIRDRFYLVLDRRGTWFFVYVAHTLFFFLAGFAAGALMAGETLLGGLQLGLSCVVWGVLVRTVVVWHITWSVNSLTHVLGYRNYETPDVSRNNWFVAIIASGEGWHNNHHAEPNSAAAGHRWWEFDLVFQIIRVLSFVGLAYDIIPVRGHGARVHGESLGLVDAEGRHREFSASRGEESSDQKSLPTAAGQSADRRAA